MNIFVTSQKEKEIIKFYLKSKAKKNINLIQLGTCPISNTGIKNTKKYFLYLGRFNKIKNLEFVCNEFINFMKHNKNYELFFVGPENSYKNYLKRKYKHIKNIKFKKFISGEKKNKLISNTQALIVASFSENFNYSLIEALSMGVPIIYSDKIDLSLYLKKYNCGLDFNIKSGLLEKNFIRFVNLKPAARKSMSQNAINLHASKFDIKKNYSSYIDLLN